MRPRHHRQRGLSLRRRSRPPSTVLQFDAACGPLRTHWDGRRVFLELPRMDVTESPVEPDLERALGTRVVRCLRSVDDLVAEVESAQAVERLRPDFAAIAAMPCRGLVVTAAGEAGGRDFVSRSFFPRLGVDEDQVCVSAHCKLGPLWASRLGRQRLTALQLSPRGGELVVEVVGDRVHVAGSALVRGAVLLPRVGERVEPAFR